MSFIFSFDQVIQLKYLGSELLQVKVSTNFVRIFSFTKAEWLDVVEIEFQPGWEKGTVGKVR